MPIYEYRCLACEKLSSFFVRSIGSEVNAVCGNCQGTDMERRMSTFAMGKTTASVHEAYSSGREHRSMEYYQDPRNIGRGVESAFAKHSMDMPQSVRDNIDAARSGEAPKGLDL